MLPLSQTGASLPTIVPSSRHLKREIDDMTPIVVFDLGKVLVDFDYSIAAKKVAARSTKHIENLHAVLGGSQVLLQLESGLITREQFFNEVQKMTGFSGTADE